MFVSFYYCFYALWFVFIFILSIAIPILGIYYGSLWIVIKAQNFSKLISKPGGNAIFSISIFACQDGSACEKDWHPASFYSKLLLSNFVGLKPIIVLNKVYKVPWDPSWTFKAWRDHLISKRAHYKPKYQADYLVYLWNIFSWLNSSIPERSHCQSVSCSSLGVFVFFGFRLSFFFFVVCLVPQIWKCELRSFRLIVWVSGAVKFTLLFALRAA